MTEQHDYECFDPELGWRIHEYELGTLDSETADRFEEHLLVCDGCRHRMEVTLSAMTELAEHRAEIRELLKAESLEHVPQSLHYGFPAPWRRAFQSVYVRYFAPALAVAVVAGIFILRTPAPVRVEQSPVIPPEAELRSDAPEPSAVGMEAAPMVFDTARTGDDLLATPPASRKTITAPLLLERPRDAAVPQVELDIQAESTPPPATAIHSESLPPAKLENFLSKQPGFRVGEVTSSGSSLREMITREPLPWPLPEPEVDMHVRGGRDIGTSDEKAYYMAAPPPARDTVAVQAVIAQAEESYRLHDYHTAAPLFERAAGLDSTKPVYKLMAAVSYYLARDYEATTPRLAILDSLLAGPDDLSARWYLANAALAMNDSLRADSLLVWLSRSPSMYQQQSQKLLNSLRAR